MLSNNGESFELNTHELLVNDTKMLNE